MPLIPENKSDMLDLWIVMYSYANGDYPPPSGPYATQRTIESEVNIMRLAVDRVYRKPRHDAVRVKMHQLLSQSLELLEEKRVSEGRMVFVEFRELVEDTKP